jgi:Na+/H+ antiporter NhaD/arsenite permease-like protein
MKAIPTSLQPFLKAIAPALLTLVAVLVEWLVNGTWSRTNTATAITGLVAATITSFVPNLPADVLVAPIGVAHSQTEPTPLEHAGAPGSEPPVPGKPK